MLHKRDADNIWAFMQELPSELRLDKNRRWWPFWLFRSDHVENAAAILNSGELLSRAGAAIRGLIVKDSASQQHINQLDQCLIRFVRLYFRPRTPTRYSNKGVRPVDRIKFCAHMPVPVYLLFISRLLLETGVLFSRGRLTSNASVGEPAGDLKI
ncbi:MAG: DarT ssDNA thymidine ADP-ribosyltransferase family protein [Albidovulum sp.]|nr:DarT ssDNA thymidine ADP-ribosyltransferase family protein [Albidovulum sp.]